MKNRGLNLVANAVGQAADHIDSFLHMLRIELAFYVGCLNLSDQLSQLGAPITFPTLVAAHERSHTFQGLYDVCLALTMKQKLEKHVKVFFVTHLYEFANGFFNRRMANALFLRAERKADGRRTFKLIPGEPLQTSYGGDLYKQVFGAGN